MFTVAVKRLESSKCFSMYFVLRLVRFVYNKFCVADWLHIIQSNCQKSLHIIQSNCQKSELLVRTALLGQNTHDQGRDLWFGCELTAGAVDSAIDGV